MKYRLILFAVVGMLLLGIFSVLAYRSRNSANVNETLSALLSPDIDELRNGLSSSDAETRRRAAENLASVGPDAVDVVPQLIQMLVDPDARVRLEAAHALTSIDPGEDGNAIPTVEATSAGPDRHLRWLALRHLTDLGSRAHPAVSTVSSALQDKDPEVRSEAFLCLQQMGIRPADLPLLLKGLTSTDQFTRECSACLIGSLGAEGKAATAPLTKAMNDEEPVVGVTAAAALLRISPADSVSYNKLLAFLSAEDPAVHTIARDALLRRTPPEPRAVAALRQDARSPARAVREKVVQQLLSLCEEQPQLVDMACQLLAQALDDSDTSIRQTAVGLLRELKSQGRPALPALLRALHDADSSVRDEAVQAIGNLGNEGRDAAPHLLKLLRTGRSRFSIWVAAALCLVDRGNETAVSFLCGALRQGQGDTRAEACMALHWVTPLPAECAPILAQLAHQDGNPNVRRLAMHALENLPQEDDAVLPPVASALNDPDLFVRRAALETLLKHPWLARKCTAEVANDLEYRDKEVQKLAAQVLGNLGAAGQSSVPALLKAYENPYGSVRLQVIQSLLQIAPSDHRVKEVLALAKKDKDWRVRAAASQTKPDR
jgi:HEAT repeat protein